MIPEKKEGNQRKERIFQMRLPTMLYLRLEKEAAERGVTSYQLSRAVLESWLLEQSRVVGGES